MKLTILSIILLLIACRTDQVEPFLNPDYNTGSLPVSGQFDSQKKVCRVADQALNEISGLAESAAMPGNFWVEEDSGNENKIYLLSAQGKTIGVFRMTTVDDRDWEDIAISAGPAPGIHHIYLAEIGDNVLKYSTKFIYRFPEPAITGRPLPIVDDISRVDKIAFQYPDGNKNAEAILVDPISLDLYVITKEQRATVYKLPYPQSLSKVTLATKLGTLPISTVTSASVSGDGSEILIKNYTTILYWKRQPGESLSVVLGRNPVQLVYSTEPKGEAICWTNDGSGYFTTSEIVDTTAATLFSYKRK